MDLYNLASAFNKAGCPEAAEELRRHIGPT